MRQSLYTQEQVDALNDEIELLRARLARRQEEIERWQDRSGRWLDALMTLLEEKKHETH